MSNVNHLSVIHWSTDDVAPSERSESVIAALDRAIVPVGMEIKDTAKFAFHMDSIELADGCVLLHQKGSAHRTYRRNRELARSEGRTFHFMLNLASDLLIEHCGRNRVRAGDAILIDSEHMLELTIPNHFEVIHIKMSEEWLHRWLAPVSALIGQRVSSTHGVDRALTTFAAQLAPTTLACAALNPATLAQQFATMLAMVGNEHGGKRSGIVAHCADTFDLAIAIMKLHSAEPLTICALAEELKIPEAQIEAALASNGHTFSSALAALRLDAVARMRNAPNLNHLPLAELYARAGFTRPRDSEPPILAG
ncbi:hypothetical protein E4K72_21225 [Oxalobacteraceae bacterium OM1]|nr:hypothetical protein E4K72_21225 [Oxalobacteraceae bacterium OM1]